MLRIGLTGGIGSGKTTVAHIFEVLGIPVYYADNAAKLLMHEDEHLKQQIIEQRVKVMIRHTIKKIKVLSLKSMLYLKVEEDLLLQTTNLLRMNSLVHFLSMEELVFVKFHG